MRWPRSPTPATIPIAGRWHFALATPGPDADIAAELEARRRSSSGAWRLGRAAAMLERSAVLTLDPEARVRRTIGAARAHVETGRVPDRYRTPCCGRSRSARRADAGRDRGGCANTGVQLRQRRRSDRPHLPRAPAPRARRPAARPRLTYSGTLSMAVTASDLSREIDLEQAAACDSGRAAVTRPGASSGTAGRGTRDEHDRRRGRGCTTPSPSPRGLPRRGDVRGRRLVVWGPVRRCEPALGARHVLRARPRGKWKRRERSERCECSRARCTPSPSPRSSGELAEGRHAPGRSGGHQRGNGEQVGVVRHREARSPGEDRKPRPPRPSTPSSIAAAHKRRVLPCGPRSPLAPRSSNSVGRYQEALIAAGEAARLPADWAIHLTLHELVEAAVRSGQPEAASETMERVSASAQASGTDWALGIESRSRALLATGRAAETLYLEATERLDRSPCDQKRRVPT